MGNSGGWWYEDPGDERDRGPSVPPQWQQERPGSYQAPRYQDSRQQRYPQQPPRPPQASPRPQYQAPGPQFTPREPPPASPRQPRPGAPYWPSQDQFAPPARPPAPPAPRSSPKPAAKARPAPKAKGKPSVFGCGCLAALAAALVLGAWFLVSGHGSGGTAAAPATQTAPASCASQLAAWAGTGEGSRLTAFGTDTGTFSGATGALAAGVQDGDATTGEMSAVQSAAGTMQADAQALRASPGPSCVPGLADNLHAAALDISAAATAAGNGITQMSAGNTGTATSDMDAAAAELDQGNARITAADKALTSYEASTRAKAAPKTRRTAAASSQAAAPAAPAQTTQAAAPAPPASTAPASCYPLTDEGTCYQPGEYCRDDDHGMSGVAGDGEAIICEDNDGWRWEPA